MWTAKLSRNTNKVANSNTNKNYWSPLTCLVEEQEQPKAKKEPKSESSKELKLLPKDRALNIPEQERRQIGATYATEVENLEQERERRLTELENDMVAFNRDKRLQAL